ncbi:MAG TPA: PHB depolymerase family esterase [Candidatus Binataceae bacterium]
MTAFDCRRFLLITFALLSISPASAASNAFAGNANVGLGDHHETVDVGGLARTYIVHVPAGFYGKMKLPAVIMLHGAGGSGEQAIGQTGWSAKGDKDDFLAVYPDGTPPDPARPARFLLNPRLWNEGSNRGSPNIKRPDDIAFISAIIDHLESAYDADSNRIYVTGFSNGASMTYRAGVDLSNRIAAIAPVAGNLQFASLNAAAPVPLLYIVGTQDPLIPLAGGDVKLPWGNVVTQPPVIRSIDAWRQMLGCGGGQTKLEYDGVKEVEYDQCAKGGEIVMYTIEGQGHIWPGGGNRLPAQWVGNPTDKLNATDVIWEFFKAHPKTVPTASAKR